MNSVSSSEVKKQMQSSAPEAASCPFPSPHLFLEIAAWLLVSETGLACSELSLGGVM